MEAIGVGGQSLEENKKLKQEKLQDFECLRTLDDGRDVNATFLLSHLSQSHFGRRTRNQTTPFANKL